jgi:hypothetical protein
MKMGQQRDGNAPRRRGAAVPQKPVQHHAVQQESSRRSRSRQTGVQFKFGEGSEMEHAAFVSAAALIAAVEEGKLSATELLTAGAIGAAIIELAKRLERETK